MYSSVAWTSWPARRVARARDPALFEFLARANVEQVQRSIRIALPFLHLRARRGSAHRSATQLASPIRALLQALHRRRGRATARSTALA
jgi:hypothetical protein